MPTITRRFEFDSGHRILNHESKCRFLHGHRYVAEVTVWSAGLDNLGRVIDFGEIKKIIGGWIDENWDHNLILSHLDPLARLSEANAFGRPIFLIPLVPGSSENPDRVVSNPTAEVLCHYLFGVCQNLLPDYLQVKRVKLWETPNCWAVHPDE